MKPGGVLSDRCAHPVREAQGSPCLENRDPAVGCTFLGYFFYARKRSNSPRKGETKVIVESMQPFGAMRFAYYALP